MKVVDEETIEETLEKLIDYREIRVLNTELFNEFGGAPFIDLHFNPSGIKITIPRHYEEYNKIYSICLDRAKQANETDRHEEIKKCVEELENLHFAKYATFRKEHQVDIKVGSATFKVKMYSTLLRTELILDVVDIIEVEIPEEHRSDLKILIEAKARTATRNILSNMIEIAKLAYKTAILTRKTLAYLD